MVEEKGLMPEEIYDADETGDMFTAKNSCFQSRKICSRIQESKGCTISFACITVSLIFIFSIIQTLGYLDYLLKSQRVQIIEV